MMIKFIESSCFHWGRKQGQNALEYTPIMMTKGAIMIQTYFGRSEKNSTLHARALLPIQAECSLRSLFDRFCGVVNVAGPYSLSQLLSSLTAFLLIKSAVGRVVVHYDHIPCHHKQLNIAVQRIELEHHPFG